MRITLNRFTKRRSHQRVLLPSSGSRFRVYGCVGLVCAIFVTTINAAHLGLSFWIVLLIISINISMFLGRLLMTKILGGTQQLVFYHHFIALLLVTTAVLWLLGQPVLPYLDVTVLGMSAFVACGRIGCLMVGCCHGRPSNIGICYREWQVTAAFPAQFLGVRLFPIQAVESLWLFFIVIGGCYQIWNGYAPGVAVVWFIVAYCPARFVFEFARWRPEYSYYWGLSEAQWTPLFLVMLLVISELVGVLAFSLLHILIVAALAAVTTVVVVRTKLQHRPNYRLNNSNHLKKISAPAKLSDQGAVAPDGAHER